MFIAPWSKELECGIDLIDKQHKDFFKAINAFHVNYKFNRGKASALECLNFLENYVLYHFQTEEAFQRESNFPKRNEHHAMHEMLAIELKKLSISLKATNFSDVTIEQFYYFIQSWLNNHTLGDDLEFSKYHNKVILK